MFAATMGVIWAGFPLIVAVILFRYRMELKDPAKRHQTDLKGVLFLVEPYRQDVR